MSRKTLYSQVIQLRMRCVAPWRCCCKAVMQGMSAFGQYSQNAATCLLTTLYSSQQGCSLLYTLYVIRDT